MKRLVVVGGSDAGISAALRAREVDPGCQVQMIVADRFPNYSICGLPFFLSGETPKWESLAHRSRAEIEERGIELLLDTVAEHIDPSEHRIVARESSGALHELEYDRMVIGTGAVPARPSLDGLDLPGVYQLHSMADSFGVYEHLTTRDTRSAVVVGGGYIGLEMADALRHRGLAVTVLESSSSLLQTVDGDFGDRVQVELQRNGVNVRTGARVESIERFGQHLRVHADDGVQVEADLVLVVTGVRPAIDLGRACGVAIGARGAFRVNRHMATNIVDIYAAGDCVETHHRMMKAPAYLPLGTTAHKQGRVAGENAAGGNAEFQGSLGTQVVKVFGLVVGRTGLRDEDALREGHAPLTVESSSLDHKAYYPGATELFIRVTADCRTRRLLGAQVLGAYGAEVSKRIDVFATALYHDMAIEAIAGLDLSYTPPLSSPWDPIQMSCMELARHLKLLNAKES